MRLFRAGLSHTTPSQRLRRLSSAWDALTASEKADLMVRHPDLYWACAWLAADVKVNQP